ncbi:Fur-regulated basic protein FbpA [Pseudalkalibacillus caeni]|uniref:Fur-regulated basic protein FbpA n=1 Tax=Exobacillus caeni TaxID=2574798 RepID=A0A5R9F8U6_9BACL|nr:Fur-regulated basic protein FbpA [Pseudalkalibacillus caeni]TLS38746.1 Fur-regulated basic protein FbpA [Pseudalkalibacillus caeni]
MQPGQLRQALEKKRRFYINHLIAAGVYKKSDSHLYECTLTDLEKEYQQLSNY